MTQRSVHTTQSKLTVQAPAVGCGVPAICAVLGAMAAAHILVRCPVSGVGSFNGSLLGCFRRDVALCHTASRAWNGERRTCEARGRFLCFMVGLGWRRESGETAHFMCVVLS
ncbi:hypothetical protein [Desulfosporosinus fructosivorans]